MLKFILVCIIINFLWIGKMNPQAPANFNFGKDSLLHWTPVQGCISYQVFYQTSGSPDWYLLYSGKDTMCRINSGMYNLKAIAFPNASQPPDYGPVETSPGNQTIVNTTNPISHSAPVPNLFSLGTNSNNQPVFSWKAGSGTVWYQIFESNGEDWHLLYSGPDTSCAGHSAPWILMGRAYATQPPDYGPVQSITIP